MRIDHVFSMVLNDDEYSLMEKLGFNCDRTKDVEHPGRKICSFIYFVKNRTYLEFVRLADPEAFCSEYREEVENHGVERYNGISLQRSDVLKEFYSENEVLLSQYSPNYVHRNYKWKENSEDYLPGWNFLFFKNPIIPHTRVWFTEYEELETPSIKKKRVIQSNPNSVDTFKSVIVSTDSENEVFNMLEGEGIELELGHRDVSFDKIGAVKAVVLKAESFDTFLKVAEVTPNFSFEGRPAYRIERDQYCFDIIIC